MYGILRNTVFLYVLLPLRKFVTAKILNRYGNSQGYADESVSLVLSERRR
jgi:hypothetical protein